MFDKEIQLCFDDVLIKPQFSDIKSRSEVKLDAYCNGLNLSVPIISSPMDTVTEYDMYKEMSKLGGLGVIHRYNTIEEQVKIASFDPSNCCCAVGVSGDFLERTSALVKIGVQKICIDVAHGHTAAVRDALWAIRKEFGVDLHIMAGNVATLSGFNDLSDWGANSVRIGIGGGSICSTRLQTGHGMPTFASILECAKSDREAALIADGGIRTAGDIVKALGAGADAVMLGSMLAGTDETPGEIIAVKGKSVKVYRGMASKEAQYAWRGHTASLEGVSSTVELKGPVKDVMFELTQNIRSGLSYSGSRSITEFQSKVQFIRQTSLAAGESKTHIDKS
tara:strand:+ start:3503 stop:4510 length:1008 start_codon:yes stop_codon:yes gene_type:complete